MGEPIDAMEVVANASATESDEAFDALFAAGGVEGDGDLVLHREGDKVTVAGRLDPEPIWVCVSCGFEFPRDLRAVVEPSDA